MGMNHFLSDSTQSQKVLIRINSWLILALQELIQISSRVKMDFFNLIQIDSRLKKLLEGLIQINSRLRKFPEFWFKSTHDSKRYLEYWLESSHGSMIKTNSWFRWPFWAFTVGISLTFLGLPLNFVDLFWEFNPNALIRIRSWLK